MKKIVVLGGFLMLSVMLSCVDKKQTPTEILGNRETRTEVMQAISNDQDLMTEMLGYMQQNDRAVQMMLGNQGMMGKMMGNQKMMMGMIEQDTAMAGNMMDNMMAIMEKDSTMCKTMCRRMSGNQHMKMMMQNGMAKDSMMVCPMHRKMNQ
tara:strand:+ start:1493 stop:1945 length:453 start_codon:yes stop_codon:yes gene_type:complete